MGLSTFTISRDCSELEIDYPTIVIPTGPPMHQSFPTGYILCKMTLATEKLEQYLLCPEGKGCEADGTPCYLFHISVLKCI